jgi:hypothetical protein
MQICHINVRHLLLLGFLEGRYRPGSLLVLGAILVEILHLAADEIGGRGIWARFCSAGQMIGLARSLPLLPLGTWCVLLGLAIREWDCVTRARGCVIEVR